MIDKFRGSFGFLSNMSECKISINGYDFKSLENAYQSCKCKNPEDIELFLNITPVEAKVLGNSIQRRDDWDSIKLEIMETLVHQKFSQNETLKFLLLMTGNEKLIECNKYGDTFWGVCNGIGNNHLGKILMRVRDKLNKENK